MKERRENDGYCFIRGRTQPRHILSALHNIPYDLLPPTLKRAEDLLTEIGIQAAASRTPELGKITDDLVSSSKRMEEMYEKHNKDKWMFKGTIPYIKNISKCDFGQSEVDMAKDIDIRQFYLGLEDAMYTFSRSLRNIENILNDAGKDLINEKHRDGLNDISIIASDIYRNKYTDFSTSETMKIKEELNENMEIREAFDFKSKEYDELSERIGKLADKRDKSQEDAVAKFKKGIHDYWLEDWYDKYAWDFDEEERKELKNPYK